ncbi:MAG TPA: prolyl oligopeptidase family serine peptidase [Tepidisphaeraceae bacterium]|nr:prolyl oligopeptidase family serine peptidase [Tepidisphaeraceae bacterium]
MGSIRLLGKMLFLLLVALMTPAVAEITIPPAPATPQRPVIDTLHGTAITDPFRWLEGDAKGNATDEVARWTDAHNARTRAVLDGLPRRAAIESRLRELMEITSVSAPKMARNRYFHTKRQGKQNQPVLYVRDGHNGPSRVLIDPNTLDQDWLVTLAWSEPSHDGTLLAFGTYRAGDENTVCHVLDVDTGRWRDDEIEGKVNGVQWMPDSSGFFYRRLADVKNPYSGQIKFHRIGTNASEDKLLFEQYKDGPLATTWGPFAQVSRDGRWMILGYYTSTKANDLWVVDLDRWFRSGEFSPIEIVKGLDARFGGHVNGDTLLMTTTLDAPNGRVFAVDLHRPQRERWREIISERKDAAIEQVDLARGVLAINYQQNATTQIRLFDLNGTFLDELELPGIGSASLSTESDRTEAFLTFTSFNTPPRIYRLDLTSPELAARSVWDAPDVPVDPSLVEVKQVFYPSKDGTRISMFLVHRKGLALDGNNPTLLYGYGGFANSMTPWFSATMFPWFEAGGVYAIPNLRGGGEYGQTWHTGGILASKQNTFDDFLAAAEWLIASRYMNQKRLGIVGGSNGGLLVGAAITQRPDLFAAAVSAVPLLDMLRYQNFLMARYWIPEYGSAEDAEQFKYLVQYSPYHRIKPGTNYPAVFLTAGENDTRVHPLHARKMAARLLASNEARQGSNPVLLWVDRDAGHGQGKPLNLRVRDQADVRIFLMWQLGMLPVAPTTTPATAPTARGF